MSVLLALLLIGCFALGVALLPWPKRAGFVSTRLMALPLGVGGLGLLLADDVRVRLPVQWLPEQVPAELALTGSARYLVAGILAWAALSLWQHNDLSPPAWSGYGPGLMLITSALTIFAVIIDHFLLRYVTLELVALVTAACLAVALPAYRGAPLVWRAYLPWRLVAMYLGGADTVWRGWGFAVYAVKVAALVAGLSLVQVLYARLRIDQLAEIGWRALVPLAMAQMLVAIWI